jgi:hypothetical protein
MRITIPQERLVAENRNRKQRQVPLDNESWQSEHRLLDLLFHFNILIKFHLWYDPYFVLYNFIYGMLPDGEDAV